MHAYVELNMLFNYFGICMLLRLEDIIAVRIILPGEDEVIVSDRLALKLGIVILDLMRGYGA